MFGDKYLKLLSTIVLYTRSNSIIGDHEGGMTQLRQVLGELEEKGVVCLQSYFDRQFVEKMRSEAIALLTMQIDGVRTEYNPGGSSVRVYPQVLGDPHCPNLGRALKSEFLKRIAVGYKQKCLFLVDAVITHDRTPSKITDTHFDIRRSLKFMIYLSDVDKERAAFRYCLGSHRANTKLRNLFSLMGGRLQELPNVPAPSEGHVLTDMEGPSGTLVIFDTDGFHSAGTLEKGKERLLIRGRTLLNGWLDNKIVRRAAEQNPFRALIPLLMPEGRLTTGGYARARAPQ